MTKILISLSKDINIRYYLRPLQLASSGFKQRYCYNFVFERRVVKSSWLAVHAISAMDVDSPYLDVYILACR